jgi:hypothetical protein
MASSSSSGAAAAAAASSLDSSLYAQARGVRQLEERRWRGRSADQDEDEDEDEECVPETAFFYSLPPDHWRLQMLQPVQGFAVPPDPPPSAAAAVAVAVTHRIRPSPRSTITRSFHSTSIVMGTDQ